MSSGKFRATSPRRDTGRVHTVDERERERAPIETPQNPNSPAPRTNQNPPAFAHSVYERRMNRSKSPNVGANTTNNNASLVATPGRTGNQSYRGDASPAAYNVNASRTEAMLQGERNNNSASYPVQTPGAPYRTPPPGTTAGNSASYGVPVEKPVGSLHSINAQGQMQVHRGGTGYVDVPHPTHPQLMPTADLALTAPDRALLEMLRAEAQDRHFVEKLFVAQEEKHERNQWISIEGHRRRMMQLAFAAPLRIARMEAIQERKVGEMIAEFEVGDEVTEQRRRMDDRISDLRDMISNVNTYRAQLEEQEHDHKTAFDRTTADLESDKRNKKRLLDELTRQYEFATIHSRKDEIVAQNYGRRIMTDDYMRSARRSPPPYTSPIVDARAIEKVVETRSSAGFALTQTAPLLDRAPDVPRYALESTKPASGYNSPGVNVSLRLANRANQSNAATVDTNSSLTATPVARRASHGGHTPTATAPLGLPAADTRQSLMSDRSAPQSNDVDEIIRRGQAALHQADTLEREAAGLRF